MLRVVAHDDRVTEGGAVNVRPVGIKDVIVDHEVRAIGLVALVLLAIVMAWVLTTVPPPITPDDPIAPSVDAPAGRAVPDAPRTSPPFSPADDGAHIAPAVGSGIDMGNQPCRQCFP